MTLGVFLAVLCAAFLHAAWNGLIRTGNPGGSRLQNLLVMALVQGMIGVGLLVLAPLPPAAVWPWLVAAAALHTGYKLCLSVAYDHGDLSRVYPLARGSAPLMVLVASAVVGADVLSGAGVAAVLVLGLGILTMAAGALRSGENRRLIPWALATAVMTTGYTLVDGLGARAAGHLLMFLGWTFALDGLFFGLCVAALRGPAIFRVPARGWGMGALAAMASLGAYGVVVWAMTEAPIALVGALRETSILFAMLIGWRLFGERMGRDKVVAGGLILLGVGLMRVAA
ncbi:MAG: EamA family transporter [Rhodobacter sp.]|nr:EamA family transporter [Rhodobacter sp.]